MQCQSNVTIIFKTIQTQIILKEKPQQAFAIGAQVN
jgi:hypothetical protein